MASWDWDTPYNPDMTVDATASPVQPGAPGTYIGRDGNWYDANGNNLGPSGQDPFPVQPTIGPAVTQGPGTPSGQATDTASPTGTSTVAAPNLSSGALAPYSVAPPTFPNEPAYEASQFKAPSIDEALKDPGYQFERDQSIDTLQRWAAARGTLNDSGTATALMDLGRNAATQRLGDVWGRAYTAWDANENARRQAYGMNRQSQFIDPWTAQYNAWAQQGNWYLQNQGTVANAALDFARL